MDKVLIRILDNRSVLIENSKFAGEHRVVLSNIIKGFSKGELLEARIDEYGDIKAIIRRIRE